MPELPVRPTSSASSYDHALQAPQNYRIIRKGSRYNIVGPNGRIFNKYKSASTAGPRWEELTQTPWPHQSTAYESGLRLWEMGIIPRDQIGQTKLRPKRKPNPAPRKSAAKSAMRNAASKQSKATAPVTPPEPESRSTPDLVQEKTAVNAQRKPAMRLAPAPAAQTHLMPVKQLASPSKLSTQQPTATLAPLPKSPPALPAPKIDLARQRHLIAALRKDPRLLFNSDVQTALRHEVEYHRPYAKWAQNLLKLLARYETRRRKQAQPTLARQNAIMARHIAWQEQRLHGVARVN